MSSPREDQVGLQLVQETERDNNKVWRHYILTGEFPRDVPTPWYAARRLRPWVRHVPAEPRCRICYYPFEGLGGWFSRILFGIQPSRVNPYFCNQCEQLAEQFPGGAEVDVTILFADMRESTRIAETLSPVEFSQLVRTFYHTTTRVLFDTNAIVEKLVGDAVTGFYTPGFSGGNHALVGIQAARRILHDLGYGISRQPVIPVGIGVHTGVAYVGTVAEENEPANITILGDMANIGARLASLAGPGEIYISQATADASGIDTDGFLSQHLAIKGRSQPVDAWVISI